MELNYKFYPNSGSKEDIYIILHGLFGSSKNWVTISKFLSSYGDVYSLDLRNHGDSPHAEEHSIAVMAKDLDEFIQKLNLKNVILFGHSMGGLVSMYYDFLHPATLKKLIIQDIAPRSYPFAYSKEIEAMKLPLSGLTNRSEIDSKLATVLSNDFIRQFLLMSLERNEDGSYHWKLNVDGLDRSRRLFEDNFTDMRLSRTDVLFLLGANSEYITKEDVELIARMYPNAKIKNIVGGGHYIHFTHQKEFLEVLAAELN
ncbi:alpha/beta fold hydrolase [Leptospira sp. 96542]|nr:alpha/beta fold hydrolase [Leptospira sp. 96542]